MNNTLLAGVDNTTAEQIVTIESINDTVTVTSEEISRLEGRTLNIMSLLIELESRIEATKLVSSEEYDNIAALLTSLEEMSDEIGDLLAAVSNDVEQLDTASSQLEEKYTEIQLHRDLLHDIQYSLEKLDCDKEYNSGTVA